MSARPGSSRVAPKASRRVGINVNGTRRSTGSSQSVDSGDHGDAPMRKTASRVKREEGPRGASSTPRGSGVIDLPSRGDSSQSLASQSLAGSRGEKAEDSQVASIQVIARVRPKLPTENAEEGVEVHVAKASLMLHSPNGQSKTFTVDQVYDSRLEQGSQAALFQNFGMDFVKHSLSGYNVCLFAYGHTGSGKTYTMLGHKGTDSAGDMAGLLPRFLRDLFLAHEEDDQPGRHYTCEFYEVYNEHIRDLLVYGKTGERTRKVHAHPKFGVRVEGLSCNMVESAAQALGLVEFGNQMRAVATTTMNSRSSRSHAVFTFKYEQSSAKSSRRSAVTFVDLAGREDQTASDNKAQQFREMCCINTSLFHLANVITKLSKGTLDNSLTEFRNSKLTLLLSPALVGNSKTALIATVAPPKHFFDDSLCTMNFAASVKKIKTKPFQNNKTQSSMVAEMEDEMKLLKAQLLRKDSEIDTEKDAALATAEAMIADLKKSWEDEQAKSQSLMKARKKSLAFLGLGEDLFGDESKASGGDLTPFLTKLSDDPSLQGRCNYMLPQGERIILGSDHTECTIVLHGLGILDEMCVVTFDQGEVQIEIPSSDDLDDGSDKRVLVNGYPFSEEDGARTLDHGACVFLGYSHAFRLVIPTKEAANLYNSTDPAVLSKTVDTLDVASAVQEIVDDSGAQFKDILPFINNLSARESEDTIEALEKALHCICPKIDEANLMTKEIFGDDTLHFSLQALTNVLNFTEDVPEFAVCLLQKETAVSKFRKGVLSVVHEKQVNEPLPPAPSRRESLLGKARHPLVHELGLADHMQINQNALLYVWSLEKFLSRLRAIRDIYQEASDSEDAKVSIRLNLSANPSENPWREVSFEDSAFLAELCKNDRHGGASGMFPTDGSESARTSVMSEHRASVMSFFGASVPSRPHSQDQVLPVNAPKGKRVDAGGRDPLEDSEKGGCSIEVKSSTRGCSTEMSEGGSPGAFSGSGHNGGSPQSEAATAALGDKIENLSQEVLRLQDVLLHQQSGQAAAVSAVDRDSLERLKDCIDDFQRLAHEQKQRQDQAPVVVNQESSMSSTVADQVLLQVQSVKTDVAKIVKEELQSQLKAFHGISGFASQQRQSSNGNTFCSLPVEVIGTPSVINLSSGHIPPNVPPIQFQTGGHIPPNVPPIQFQAGGLMPQNVQPIRQVTPQSPPPYEANSIVYRPRLHPNSPVGRDSPQALSSPMAMGVIRTSTPDSQAASSTYAFGPPSGAVRQQGTPTIRNLYAPVSPRGSLAGSYVSAGSPAGLINTMPTAGYLASPRGSLAGSFVSSGSHVGLSSILPTAGYPPASPRGSLAGSFVSAASPMGLGSSLTALAQPSQTRPGSLQLLSRQNTPPPSREQSICGSRASSPKRIVAVPKMTWVYYEVNEDGSL